LSKKPVSVFRCLGGYRDHGRLKGEPNGKQRKISGSAVFSKRKKFRAREIAAIKTGALKTDKNANFTFRAVRYRRNPYTAQVVQKHKWLIIEPQQGKNPTSPLRAFGHQRYGG